MGTILNPDDFPTTLTVSSVSPSVASAAGGQEIVLTGTFKGEAAQVFVIDTEGNDIPCYSGTAGDNYFPCPDNGTTLRAVLPPLDPVDGDYAYSIKVTQGLDSVTLADAVEIRRREYHDLVFSTRRLLPRWYRAGAVDGAISEALPVLPSPVFILSGEAFAASFDGAITYAPNDENESIGAPSSTRNIIFGVRGSVDQPNWRGFIEGSTSSTYRVFCDRYSDGRMVVLFAAQASVVCTIKSATGATLATTASASRQQAIIFCVSADGQSLEWGPRYFKMSDTPTPESSAYVIPTGLTVRDNVILAQLQAGLLPASPTAITTQNQVVDLDGGAKTFTVPYMNPATRASAYQLQTHILAKCDPTDGSVLDGHWHAPNDGDPDGGTWMQYGIQGSVPSTTTVGAYPDFSFGNPVPNADATKVATSVSVRAEGGYTNPNGFSWAQGSTTEISIGPPFSGSRYPGGVFCADLNTSTMPALWLRRSDCWDNASDPTHQAESRGSIGTDAAGRYYFGIHFNVNALNSDGLTLFPGDTDVIAQNTTFQQQQQMICIDGNGGAVWDLEMWDTGGSNSHCQYTGCYVDEDDNEVTFLWRNGASNLPVIDPAGVAWTWDIDFRNGEPYLVTVNKTTGALVRATRFIVRDSGTITTAGREVYMPRSLTYDPTNDLLRIGLLLRPVVGNPAATLYSQPANAAGNGAKTAESLSLPVAETDMQFVMMAVNPTTHAVDSFEVIAKGSFDFEYPFDVRAS